MLSTTAAGSAPKKPEPKRIWLVTNLGAFTEGIVGAPPPGLVMGSRPSGTGPISMTAGAMREVEVLAKRKR